MVVETAEMETAAATTERHDAARSQAGGPGRSGRGIGAGPDRASVILFSLAAFLAVLALLAWQLRTPPSN